ncbi:olfactomedin-like protein 3A [Engraulis encrasicolus]|uniref:olfactomedin-like protein 3A n=1 Tax=Engraulis encrasicolus TaxID=184585 RepID=UPI002FD53DF1
MRLYSVSVSVLVLPMSLLLLVLLVPSPVAGQQQALMDYLERRLQAIEDRISLWNDQTGRYAAELRDAKQQLIGKLEGLEKSKDTQRAELEALGGRVQRVEREMDFLETHKEAPLPCVELDDKLLEQQVTVAKETIKPRYAKLSGCTDVLDSIKGMKILKRFGSHDGVWARDMSGGTGSGRVYIFNGTSDDLIYQYPSLRDFSSSSGTALATPIRLSRQWSGAGHVVYKGHAYVLEEGAEHRLLKLRLPGGLLVDSSVLPLSNLIPPYGLTPHTLLDLSVDEEGLWCVYASSSGTGGDTHHLSLAKMDADTLAVTHTWTTPCPRDNAEAAFMACGTLYVVYNTRLPGRSRVQCVYDAADPSTAEDAIHTYFPRRQGAHSSLKYSVQEKMLYAWGQGYQILYKLNMRSKLDM